jgi:hypothetical protein
MKTKLINIFERSILLLSSDLLHGLLNGNLRPRSTFCVNFSFLPITHPPLFDLPRSLEGHKLQIPSLCNLAHNPVAACSLGANILLRLSLFQHIHSVAMSHYQFVPEDLLQVLCLYLDRTGDSSDCQIYFKCLPSERHAVTNEVIIEEWCLLGCYAAWLL